MPSGLLLSLLLAPLPVQAAGKDEEVPGDVLRELAARCGEELRWAASWDEAAARAREERKPVLAVAWLYAGFDLPDGARTVFAADPDVVELVNERCVPLLLHKDTEVPFSAPEVYGLSPTVFGAALLLCAPDGRVLADLPTISPLPACDFLRAELARQPGYPGAPEPAGLAPEARAARHLARGELDAAAALLEQPGSPRGHLLRAKLLRLQRRREDALVALRTARERASSELEAALDMEELRLRSGAGRPAETRALCERLLAAGPGEIAHAAAYSLGFVELEEHGHDAAAARWRALVREHPGSPWAARAAAALLFPRAPLELGSFAPPPEDVLASLRDEPWAPLESSEAAAGEAGAVRWLLAAQRADGTWPSPTELEESAALPDEVSAAIDALCARALLARASVPGCRAAAEKTLRAFLAEGEPRPAAVLAMDYSPWRRWAWLELVLDSLAAELADERELRDAALELVEGLAGTQRPNGGWSYFVSTSLERDAPRLEQSISFMTAPVTLALLRAKEAGLDVDEDVLEAALDCLAAMRGENGTFVYMLWPGQEPNTGEAGVGGAAGRSPVCELALLGGGRSDGERLAAALELFLTHAASLDHERGKALMHAGPEGQGCHYVLFDYATAARAAAELPARDRRRVRARLSELVLATRRADGAFLDTPILGPACGTALALATLSALDAD